MHGAKHRAGTPVRVLMLNHNLREEGSFFRCWHLAKHLAAQGFSVRLMTVSRDRRARPRREVLAGVEVQESPNLLDLVYGIGPGHGILGIPYRLVSAGRAPCDVVHAFEHKPNVLLPALFCRQLQGVPLVADWADWWGFTEDGSGLQERKPWPVPGVENAMEEFMHARADWVTTISAGLAQRARSLGVPPGRVRQIPSGAPSEDIRPLNKGACRERLGIPPSIFLLGYVGSDVSDLEMVLPTLRTAAESHPRLRMAVIGPFSQSVAARHPELRDTLLCFNRVPFRQLAEYLGACDAFLLPLRDTTFNRTRWPNKFGDYVAAGRPVLCSNVGDVADIVRTEDCGLLWNDALELIAGIERLMEKDSLAKEMGDRARGIAEGRLNWNLLASEFANVYRMALDGASS